jgi:hypothetical protein
MSREFCPLNVCLDELRALVGKGASGSFYFAGTDDSIAAITLSNGVVESVSFQGRRGDLAVELLKRMETASCTFHAEPTHSARQSVLSAYAVRWLTGGATNPAPPGNQAAAKPNDRADSEKHRKVIETIAFSFLGPIAGALCEGAFADCDTLHKVIDELAANLPSDEAKNFRSQIAKATGVQ